LKLRNPIKDSAVGMIGCSNAVSFKAALSVGNPGQGCGATK